MKTQLKSIKIVEKSDVDVIFERTDGVKTFKIQAQWDRSAGSWFQWGAPAEVLSENIPEVQSFYYQRRSFDFKPRKTNADSI